MSGSIFNKAGVLPPPMPLDATGAASARAARLDKASAAAAGGQSREEIRKAAEEFESLFLGMVLKSMRDSVQETGLLSGGHAEGIYRSMLDEEYSRQMAAQRHTGLAEAIESYVLQAAGLDASGATPGPAPAAAEDRLGAMAAKALGAKAYREQGLREGEFRETMTGRTGDNRDSPSSSSEAASLLNGRRPAAM